jgi:ABC-type multidrug transport system ATPase subunit/ABC-type transporter Mla maintaining outer membrane lipid asymmetry permease subunit MlaE
MTETSSAVLAEDLCVRVGGQVLLENAELRIDPGELVLLAGPSGSGKTVLLNILGGLVTTDTPGFTVRGRLAVQGRDVIAEPGWARGKVGLVFQDFALFEGLTAEANVAFALDHRRPALTPDESIATRRDLLKRLDLDGQAKVGTLSGGQRQRVAIARALAFSPEVLAYDEPTSGLDPATRDRVAELIRETAREHETATIVVTHDLAGLTRIADRVLLFDPARRTLEEVPVEESQARLESLRPPSSPQGDPGTPRGSVLSGLARFAEGTTRTIEGLAFALLHLVPRWRSPRWGLRFLWNYLKAVAGPGALAYFALSGAVIGLVSTYFTFNFLPYRKYTESLLLDDLMGALGFGLHRILVPLIMTLLLAARVGAAISADVSMRVAGRQTDAMRSLGAEPPRYLLTGVLWAFLLGTPLVAVVSFLGARIASVAVFAAMAPDTSLHAWSGMFHRLLDRPDQWLPAGSAWVAAKTLGAAFGIAAIAYFRGARPKESPEDVAQAITSTVIAATVLVLTIHMVFALIEF